MEQHKRLTIGVELAANPGLLLFLDELTGGLDSQSTFSIVRFLKKLSGTGQAIICTIRQPPSDLIQQFDVTLALRPGSRIFYSGPVDSNRSALGQLLRQAGCQAPSNKNVAELLLKAAVKAADELTAAALIGRTRCRYQARTGSYTRRFATYPRTCPAQHGPQAAGTSTHAYATSVWTQHDAHARSACSASTALMGAVLHLWRALHCFIIGSTVTYVPCSHVSHRLKTDAFAVFIGFAFWSLGNMLQSMQGRMFTSFLVILIPPTVVNGVVPRFYQSLSTVAPTAE